MSSPSRTPEDACVIAGKPVLDGRSVLLPGDELRRGRRHRRSPRTYGPCSTRGALDEILFSWCWFHADAKAPMPVRRRLDDRDEARISVERLRGSGGSISRRSSSYLRVVPYNWTWCDDLHSYLSELKLKPENGFPAFL